MFFFWKNILQFWLEKIDYLHNSTGYFSIVLGIQKKDIFKSEENRGIHSSNNYFRYTIKTWCYSKDFQKSKSWIRSSTMKIICRRVKNARWNILTVIYSHYYRLNEIDLHLNTYKFNLKLEQQSLRFHYYSCENFRLLNNEILFFSSATAHQHGIHVFSSWVSILQYIIQFFLGIFVTTWKIGI